MTKKKDPWADPSLGEHWANFIHESVTETMLRSTGVDDPEQLVIVRRALAAELDKLANRFRLRTTPLSPNNVAYMLAQVAEEVRGWEPKWRVKWYVGHKFKYVDFLYEEKETAEKEFELLVSEGVKNPSLYLA